MDNQSEVLNGAFLNLNQLQASGAPRFQPVSSFTRQFASSLDRGNSDFDQRHNLVFFWLYSSPTNQAGPLTNFTRDWRISLLGALRSGTPFTVYAGKLGCRNIDQSAG